MIGLEEDEQKDKKVATTVYKVVVLSFIAGVYLLIFCKLMFF